ncbi:MAG: Lrp/AsnC family transcriptional regulator [Candidatus Diapherotrites archaeon]
MVYILDLLDKKILYELDINSRQSFSELAKKVGKSRNVVEYRVNKLQKDGVIKNFVTLLDAGRLGLTIWNVYLELQDITPTKEKEIIAYLKSNKKVWWVALTTGKWNLIYSIFVKDVKEFHATVVDFNSKFGKYVLNQSLAAHVEVEIFSRGYFMNKPSVGHVWYDVIEKVLIDSADKKILKELSTNARASSVDLAEKLGLTPRVVSYRIKELIRKKVISVFRLQPDVSKIGMGFYKVIVNLKNISKEQDESLKEYCRSLGNVFHYEKKIGPWLLELEMDVESFEKVNQLMKTMKEKYSDYIKSYEIMLIYAEPKGELDLTQQL